MKSFTPHIALAVLLALFGRISAGTPHPLLQDEDLPADVDKYNLLKTRCRYFEAKNYEHINFTKLSDLNDVCPSGFIVRLPIYVKGERDVFVQLSTRKNPSPLDNVYEIVLGEWGNTRVIIRRKRGYEDLRDVVVDDPLEVGQPTKFVIEITTGGDIRVFSERDKEKPLAEVNDPRPMNVKYVSFSVDYGDNTAEFFYDCGSQ